MKYKYISIILIIAFSCTQDKKKEYADYYPNNKVALSGIMLNGLKIGTWVKYDSLGNKIRELDYDSSGILTKRRIYSNGFLFAEEEMKGKDYKHGLTVTYYESGAIRSKNSFEDNRQSGEQIYYFQNGLTETEFTETDSGIIDFTQYYENGNPMVKAKSFIDGEVNMYDSLGNNLYDLLYHDNEIVDTLRVY